MRHRTFQSLCLGATVLFMTLPAPAAFPETDGTPSISASRTNEPPVMDGRLDDACWREAKPVTSFVQRQPRLGEPATFPMAVRIAFDASTLFIGFEIHSGDPSRLISTVLQRDGEVNGYDDHFAFRLDTLHNHRDLYYFYINPKGTKLDGHASDEGVVSDNNWDGVWEVKTRLMPDGWCGEIALPLSNFRFRENEDGIWGFAVITYVSATQENVMWPDMGKNSRKPSLFGHIEGLRGLEKKRPLSLIPTIAQSAATGRSERTGSDSPRWRDVADDYSTHLGLDMRFRPASTVETNIAVNPDFATVEADEFLFNLTLDELQYPEKRPFFTEGQDRFETPIQLLYTRRMGLGGYDMLGGAKLHGQSGRVSFGALDVMTGKDFGDPRFNYSAVRLKGDILRSSTIGLLAVSKDSLGAGLENENGAVGADFAWQMNRDTRLVTQYARSTRAGTGGEGYAAAASFSYAGSVFDPRDNMSVSASLEDITPDFDIRDIGYIGGTRLDRRGGRGSLGYDYWIKSDRLNRASASVSGWSYRDHGGHIRTQDGFSGQVSFETRNLVKPGFLFERSYVFLPRTGARYHNTQRTLTLQFGPYPGFLGLFTARNGDNYGDAIRYFSAGFTVKPLDRMTVNGSVARLDSKPIGSGGGYADRVMANVGFLFLFTPDLYWRSIFQGDSVDKVYLTNQFIRWEFRPGSALWLSYRETRDDRTGGFVAADRSISAKIAWLIRP